MKNAISRSVVNFVKVIAMLVVGVLLVWLSGLLPETRMGGTNLKVFVFAVVQCFVLFLTSYITGHIYGAACIAFVLPVVGYYFVGMMSPVFIAVLIFSNCMLVLFNVISLQRPNYLCRGIGLVLGTLARYGSLWLLVKIAVKQIEIIMISQNVTGEAGIEQGIALIHEQFSSGQLLATFIGGVIAFAVAPAILSFAPVSRPEPKEDEDDSRKGGKEKKAKAGGAKTGGKKKSVMNSK